MRQPLSPNRNLSDDDAAFAMPDQGRASRVNLWLLLQVVQSGPGISNVVIPGDEVLNSLDLCWRWMVGVFQKRIRCIGPDAPLVVAQAGDALLCELVRELTIQVGDKCRPFVSISIYRSASSYDKHAWHFYPGLMCGNDQCSCQSDATHARIGDVSLILSDGAIV